MHSQIDVTPRLPFTIMVKHIISQPFLLQKPMGVAVFAETLACVVRLQDPLITAEEACDVSKAAIADQACSVNDGDSQEKYDGLQQQHWLDEIKISNQFDSPRKEFLIMQTEFQHM